MILQKNYYKETLAVSFQQAEISLLVERQKKKRGGGLLFNE
jgi:hypothetical protein